MGHVASTQKPVAQRNACFVVCQRICAHQSRIREGDRKRENTRERAKETKEKKRAERARARERESVCVEGDEEKNFNMYISTPPRSPPPPHLPTSAQYVREKDLHGRQQGGAGKRAVEAQHRDRDAQGLAARAMLREAQ